MASDFRIYLPLAHTHRSGDLFAFSQQFVSAPSIHHSGFWIAFNSSWSLLWLSPTTTFPWCQSTTFRDISPLYVIQTGRQMQHTNGLTNELLSFPKTLKASVSVCAPLTTSPAFWLPTYSRMLFNWSSVGGSSLMSNSNSVLSFEACGFVDEAWSSVACATAFARLCLRRVRTRLLEEMDGEWKRVTTSFAPCYGVVLAPRMQTSLQNHQSIIKIRYNSMKSGRKLYVPLQIASSTYCLVLLW